MRIFEIGIIFLSLLLIYSCGNPKESDKSVVVEKKSESIKNPITAEEDLTKYGIANNPANVLGGLKVGDKAPGFKMLDQDGKEQSLETTLLDGPVLLVFLRAEWCSFCVRHLQEFQDNIREIHDAGDVKVIAVSPQKRSFMQKFHLENQLSFPILHDEDHSVMKDYKVFFHVTDKYNDYIEKAKGNRIEVFNGDTEPVMPIPATYLIDQNQTLKYVHYDPDYKKRSSVKELISLL